MRSSQNAPASDISSFESIVSKPKSFLMTSTCCCYEKRTFASKSTALFPTFGCISVKNWRRLRVVTRCWNCKHFWWISISSFGGSVRYEKQYGKWMSCQPWMDKILNSVIKAEKCPGLNNSTIPTHFHKNWDNYGHNWRPATKYVFITTIQAKVNSQNNKNQYSTVHYVPQ